MTAQVESPGRREPKRLEQRDLALRLPDLFDVQVARGLWDELPAECRSDHFDKANMPASYWQAVREVPSGPGGRWTSRSLSFRGLPEPMTWEIGWALHRQVELGRVIIGGSYRNLASCLRIAVAHGSCQAREAVSLLHLSADEWVREAAFARHADPSLPWVNDEQACHLVERLVDVLVYRYHRGPWWQLDVWNPGLDDRIPMRIHEPNRLHVLNFTRLNAPWLRAGAKLWLSVGLTNGRYTWSTVRSRLDALKWLQRYLTQVGDGGPSLTGDPAALRGFVLGFCELLSSHRKSNGEPLAKNPRRQTMTAIEQFFQWMFDHREMAAAELGLPAWASLRPELCVLFRPEDKPRLTNRREFLDMVLEDAVMTKIAEGAELLARPKSDGGLEDVQAFHALMLLMRTGRRINEVLMMDFEPLEPLLRSTAPPGGQSSAEAGGSPFVARLRYQQTKVAVVGSPSIPVDDEIVSIIRAQQEHARGLMAQRGNPGQVPKYLFLREQQNRNGDSPYAMATLHLRLNLLTDRLAITDSAGRAVRISKTHQFRHTNATNLLNADVPLHVVMRYFGHASADMTLHYAVTLAKTQEEQFLRFKKVTSDGRTAAADASDLLDLIQLDRRTDRVLPNGWCLLPPKQYCDKGNACLSCSRFVTDASHGPELHRQAADTQALITSRKRAFAARYGQDMGADNVWLQGRQAEVDALNRIMLAITDVSSGQAVRGSGGSG